MWLKHMKSGDFYPYNEFLAQNPNMVKVHTNPFTTPEEKLVIEDIEREPMLEELPPIEEVKEVVLNAPNIAVKTEKVSEIEPVKVMKDINAPKPKRIVKPTNKVKGKIKK